MVFTPIMDSRIYSVSLNKSFDETNVSKSDADYVNMEVPDTTVYTSTQRTNAINHYHLWNYFYTSNGYLNKWVDYEIPNSYYTKHQHLNKNNIVFSVLLAISSSSHYVHVIVKPKVYKK